MAVHDIEKRFDRIVALRGANLAVRPGEVHALVGENGAGKSTLIKILSGVHQPDSGSIEIDGQHVVLRDPHAARFAGIATVFQELCPVPTFTASEYMTLGLPYEKRFRVLVDWAAVRAKAESAASEIGCNFALSTPMNELSGANQRLVEIARGLMYSPRVVVMDEPTAALSNREVAQLFAVVRQLRSDGVAVVYVSHRLDEIFEIGDRVTVFRDGEVMGTHRLVDLSRRQLVEEITGSRATHTPRAKSAVVSTAEALSVTDLVTDKVHGVTFDVRSGEVVGLAGLVGAGRSETLLGIVGVDRVRSGEIRLHGRSIKIRSPRQALDDGIALLPEERRGAGLFTQRNIRENVTMAEPGRYGRLGLIRRSRERAAVRHHCDNLQLKYGSTEDPVLSLSGGNQQKVVLARLLESRPRVLLLDEPTKGVDVGAKQEMFRLVRQVADDGVAVVFVSSDIDEFEAVCDRAFVLREGRVVGELDGDHLAPRDILELAFRQGGGGQ